jgi:hypothetical protein
MQLIPGLKIGGKLCYVKLSGQLTETDSRVGFGNQTWRIQEDAALAIASGDCELN